ncbi:hypothetical protein [Planococcus salinus]|nr:hypothetical protein [Planococcus salinus]
MKKQKEQLGRDMMKELTSIEQIKSFTGQQGLQFLYVLTPT